ncbi:hypothetical protein [Arthrobacter sp. ES1]|uniref:hypothetical protein n=1 Tax=Arthrobacter sp. ES1 TaxID=1897056 RepID=UPI001CFFBF22|nr:hypothetical protein [Arthrobacter sp. ES1]MCB5280579.1 hypothetical protein [Arthrobacter sp. ES1]
MRALMTSEDIGTTIEFSAVFGEPRTHEAKHPWPAETVVSAGSGIVFIRNAKPGEARSYTSLFMEVYPPGAAFIRGEGESPEACEDAAWAKYRRALNCTDGSGSHDWEPRDYHNGAGFCSRCNTFGSKVFTGEQLGQLCRICGAGTTYHWHTNAETGSEEFLCEEHYEEHKPPRRSTSEHPLEQLLDSLLEADDPHPPKETS